ncbi:invasion associated locus B family protein [Aliiroseovarius marinus]|uniref:invasion associated locus B family protein n=1 Tax=Aliiroseovarius marinus TaxID=2500159 RepID=UPI003D7D434E
MIRPAFRPATLCLLTALLPATMLAQSDTDAAAAPADAARNWQVQCLSAGRAAPLVCRAAQTIVDAQGGGALLRSTVITSEGIDNATKAMLTVELPVGVHIPSGVSVGDIQLSLETCDNAACYAQIPFEGDVQAMFMAGGDQPIRFRMTADQDVNFTLQTAGFAEAYDAIKLAE